MKTCYATKGSITEHNQKNYRDWIHNPTGYQQHRWCVRFKVSYFPGLMHFLCKISLKEIQKIISNSPKYGTWASSFPEIIDGHWFGYKHCITHLSVHFLLGTHSWAQRLWESLTLWFTSIAAERNAFADVQLDGRAARSWLFCISNQHLFFARLPLIASRISQISATTSPFDFDEIGVVVCSCFVGQAGLYRIQRYHQDTIMFRTMEQVRE